MEIGSDGSGLGRSTSAAEELLVKDRKQAITAKKVANVDRACRRKPPAEARRGHLARRLTNRLCDGWNLSGPTPLPPGGRSENDNISKRNIKAQNFLRENGSYILEPRDYRRDRRTDQDRFDEGDNPISAYIETIYAILISPAGHLKVWIFRKTARMAVSLKPDETTSKAQKPFGKTFRQNPPCIQPP